MQMLVCKKCGEILPGPPLVKQDPNNPIDPNNLIPKYQKLGFCSQRCQDIYETEESKNEEEKPETALVDKLFTEWAEKIYRASEETYKKLLRLRFLMDEPKQKEKFGDLMHEKQFGKFVFTFKGKSQLGLYIRIGGHEMATDYFPAKDHIEKIKSFLSEQEEKSIDVSQQILMQLATIPLVARMIRRNALYPEFEEMEKKIKSLTKDLDVLQKSYDTALNMVDLLEEKKKENEELEKTIGEIINQLEINLGMWTYLAHDIGSAVCQGTPLFYATRNKLAEWRNEYSKK